MLSGSISLPNIITFYHNAQLMPPEDFKSFKHLLFAVRKQYLNICRFFVVFTTVPYTWTMISFLTKIENCFLIVGNFLGIINNKVQIIK